MLINNTLDGYLKDIEIYGNTWQDSENLADIRSVGTKVEGQELYKIDVLSTGKNLFDNKNTLINKSIDNNGNEVDANNTNTSGYIKIKSNTDYVTNIISWGRLSFYDENKNFLFNKIGSGNDSVYANSRNAKYIRITFNISTVDVQLEEGTQATPYEPYKEDKLTILSPTPLEKVGDVADRIVCKDGVYGVEKNIQTVVLDGSENWLYEGTGDSSSIVYGVKTTLVDLFVKPHAGEIRHLSFPLAPKAHMYWSSETEGIHLHPIHNHVYVNALISKFEDGSLESFKKWLQANPQTIKFQLATSTFIPLPHDQQVKLRTFAGRTNIHFDTEIQPTIKAQVPKSLGATVNTHTSQIDNLNKELDRVKKLEESTVSTVTSDKAFTTVNETNQGYFEDVKIEGKTLVNQLEKHTKHICDGTDANRIFKCKMIKPPQLDKEYTIVFKLDHTTNATISFGFYDSNFSVHNYVGGVETYSGIICEAFTFKDVACDTLWVWGYSGAGAKFTVEDAILLEGDYTDKDISYFEGLKSVGQDTDKISVESANENLFSMNKLVEYCGGSVAGNVYCNTNAIENSIYPVFIPKGSVLSWTVINGGNNYTAAPFLLLDKNNKTKVPMLIGSNNSTKKLVIEDNMYGIQMKTWSTGYELSNIQVNPKGYFPNYIEPKQDKKEILYYNPNTQIWEKPVLREWDSIEKHSDGKYYYHKRCEEVVFNGSENWSMIVSLTKDNTLFYHLSSDAGKNSIEAMCDKFECYSQTDVVDYECFRFHTGFQIRINKTKLSTQNVQGFKTWLQANPVTVVYQLAQEEVYECTNLDLITYQNETNLIVNSGVIQPKLELKVLSNVSNVVKLLQEKISILESDINIYMISQNRSQLDATYKSDSVTFKIDYVNSSKNMTNDYSEDLYNLILDNILVGKDNYNYNHMFNLIMDYASWNKITWEQFDELVLLMGLQHNPIEELPEELN